MLQQMCALMGTDKSKNTLSFRSHLCWQGLLCIQVTHICKGFYTLSKVTRRGNYSLEGNNLSKMLPGSGRSHVSWPHGWSWVTMRLLYQYSYFFCKLGPLSKRPFLKCRYTLCMVNKILSHILLHVIYPPMSKVGVHNL